jgi:hypothetical protein
MKGKQSTLKGLLNLREKQSDPRDPPEGDSVIWQSDGTATGNDGDIIVKTTAGGTTTTEIFPRNFPSNLINIGIWEPGVVTDAGGIDITWDADFKIYNASGQVVNVSSGSATLTDNTINHLIWRTGTALHVITTEPLGTDVPVAHVACQDGDIWDLHQESRINTLIRDIQHGLEEAFPVFVVEGCQVQEDADATNPFDVSLLAGEYYHDMHEEHTVAQIDSRTTAMRRWYHSAGAWTSDTDAEIDTGFYDDGTNKAAVAVGKYYKWLFFFTETEIHAVYPNAQYNTESAAIDSDPPDKPPGLEDLPSSTTYVFKTGDVAFEASTSDRWADVRPTLGVGTGGGGGASAFIGLSDTPASFAGAAKQAPTVNAGETALEFTSVTLSDGTVAKTGDQDYGGNQAINIVAHQFGTTVPTSPVKGMWGIHQPTGREVEVYYDGSNWIPQETRGSSILYVDLTNGTDTINNGGASGASAFATLTYAWNSGIGTHYGGDVQIYISNDTYTSALTSQGKKPNGDYNIIFTGTLSNLDTLTAGAGSVQGTGATRGTVVRSAGTWTASARANKLLRFTGGVNSGETLLIQDNTTTTATVFSTWGTGAPVATDPFVVEDWGTSITGFVTIGAFQSNVIFEDIKFNNSGTSSILGADYSSSSYYRCHIEAGAKFDPSATFQIDTCYIPGSGSDFGLISQFGSGGVITRSYVTGMDRGIRAIDNGKIKIQNGTSLTGCGTYSVWAASNSTIRMWPTAAGGYNFIDHGAATGVRAETGGIVRFVSNNQYTGGGTSEDNNTGGDDHGYIG